MTLKPLFLPWFWRHFLPCWWKGSGASCVSVRRLHVKIVICRSVCSHACWWICESAFIPSPVEPDRSWGPALGQIYSEEEKLREQNVSKDRDGSVLEVGTRILEKKPCVDTFWHKKTKITQQWPLHYVRDGSQLVLCPEELFSWKDSAHRACAGTRGHCPQCGEVVLWLREMLGDLLSNMSEVY